MEKIISQTPENEGVSEKSIAQQAGVENPFAFEKECIAKLDEYLKEQFPKTYTRPSLEDWLKALHKANVSLKEYQKFQEALLLLEYEKTDDTNPFEFKIMDDDGGESSHTAYKLKEFGSFSVYVDSKYIGDLSTIGGEAGRKERGAELFLLAQNLQEQNNSLTPDMVVKRCKEILKGKRILSLGDDIGSLSEVLRHFGAEPVGIEYDPQRAAVGRAGILSEDGNPNTRLIQGDIWDLMNDETDLIKKLNGVKFDAIVSVDLFNGGSGGEVPRDPLIKNKYSIHDWFNYFILHAQRLLKERGCQVHLGAETLPYQMHMVLSRKEEIAKGKFTLDSFGNYSADRGMNQTIKDLISSGKLELDPIGHQNVIVKK